MPDFLLPDLGEGLTEADILAWHVKAGDSVTIDQIVVEVETAKAAVEVPVPLAGVVTTLHARVGETVRVGTPLISVSATSANAPAAGSSAPTTGFAEPGVAMPEVAGDVHPSDPSESAEEPSGNVLIGYGTPPTTARRRRFRRAGGGPPAPPAESAASNGHPPAAAVIGSAASLDPGRDGDSRDGNAVAVVSPLVRKMARAAGLDIATIAGTGPGGLILRRDVENALGSGSAPAFDTDVAAGAPTPGGVQEALTEVDGGQRIAITGARKVVADKLSRSRREIPEATVWVDVDATRLMDARAELNARDPQRPVSVLALLARFAVLGLRRHPELNARVEGGDILQSSAVHLGFAAQTPRGLTVPVIRDAHRLSTRDLSGALSATTLAARDGTLRPADLSGGTFTLNNYGVFGVDGSAAIINYPEAAMLGLGRIADKPWVLGGALAVRKVTQLTLVFDHRVCDGGTAGGFLRFVADCVEAPVVALGEL